MVWWNRRFTKYFNFFIENPLKSYWKAKKYFKCPKISIHFFSNPIHNCPLASFKYIGAILDIQSHDVMWKTKYNSIRYERPPYIWICFFKRFGFSINFNIYYKDEFNETEPLDDWYWEYLLEYTKNNQKLSEAYSVCYGTSKLYYVWDYEKNEKKHKDYLIPIVKESLNKEGIKQLKKELYGNSNS